MTSNMPSPNMPSNTTSPNMTFLTVTSPKAKKKCRQYSQEYLKYGFITSITNETRPMCLLCEKTFQNDAMKPSKMKDHLGRMHPGKTSEDLNFFIALKEKFMKRPTIPSFANRPSVTNSPAITADKDRGLQASYNISLIIAKEGKSHTVGEDVILPAVKELLQTDTKEDVGPLLKRIPLSNNTVQRRIDEMAEDVKKTVTSELQNCKFAVQLDESMCGNSNILMAYVRYHSPSKKCIIDEFLFAKMLEADSNSETIFQCVEEYFHKYGIPLSNITAIAFDGAPATMSKYRGFLVFLKQTVPNVYTVHCVLHKQHLVARELSGELHNVLNVCIRAINKMKANSLNSLLFTNLCEKNDNNFTQLLHTEVRWLSKGDCLQRLVEVFKYATEFLNDIDPSLCNDLCRCRKHLFYLADLYSKFNEAQRRIQGKEVSLIQARTILIGFKAKLGLFASSLSRGDFQYFPNLSRLKWEDMEEICENDLLVYTTHLEKLKEDFQVRFEDIENMQVPEWIICPFDVEAENADIEPSMKEEFIEMSVDIEAKTLFKYRDFSAYWSSEQIAEKYPNLLRAVEPFLFAFPSSCTVEAGFSHVRALLSKQRNKLNIEERGDLRLKLTNLEPNILALVNSHPAHPSH